MSDVTELDGPNAMLRWAMEQADVRQIEIAKACNVTVGTVANWVHNRTPPGSEQLFAALQACGFSIVLEPMDE